MSTPTSVVGQALAWHTCALTVYVCRYNDDMQYVVVDENRLSRFVMSLMGRNMPWR